ncbi:MAG: sulfite exporter TauE/SafE family protein [Rhodospirillaceae bacterium]|nr:sulfite exporter TauE/SafE family protein [Rhodospirillaceae bacterium]MBT5939823.1 sulfite exporter TauE/SafE family protein [Rhodospirillaceae bacterium]MBT7266161.1 sulfite exporter TauE/SafE family protein [Rhodospirillaceae bacterium]
MNFLTEIGIQDLSGWEIIAFAAITGIGGFMRGFAGFGTTILMIPLFSLFIDPVKAVFIGMAIDAAATLPLLPTAVRQAEWRPIIPLMISSLLVTPLGAYLLVVASADTMRLAIAVMVIFSALIMISGWRYMGNRPFALTFGVGAVTGMLGTATGASGPLLAVYFLSGASLAGQIRASFNCLSIIKLSTSAFFIALASNFTANIYLTVLALLPVSYVFTWVGSKFFSGVSDQKFRSLLNYFLILVGVIIIIRTLYGSP